jgi:hypothetical protein
VCQRFQRRLTLLILPVALLLMAVFAPTAHGWAGPDGGIIENRGQLPDAVKYYACDGEATVYFTDAGVVIDLPARGHAVLMRFVQAQRPSKLEAGGQQPVYLNSYLGRNPERWKSGLRVFSELVYRDLWPGVDLRLQAVGGELRYRLLAAPGSGPGSEHWEGRFAFEGVDGITTDAAGVTELEIPGGKMTEASVSSDGSDRILRWAAGAGMSAELLAGEVTFDKDNPSTLGWSTFLGGADNDYSHGLGLDSFQRPVVTGYTRSANFPTTVGAYDRTHAGSYDVFVAKLDASGSTVLWGTFIGGTLEDRPFALEVDAADNVVVAGHTFSSDFPTTVGAYDRTLSGVRDAFVVKLNAAGSALMFSTYLGGNSYERVWGLALDSSGQPVVAGETGSADYPTTAGAFDTVFGGAGDGFVAKLDAAGQSLLWSTFLGGASADWVNGLTIDAADCPVAVGTTFSGDYPTTPGAFDRASHGDYDAFLTKLQSDGSSLVYSSYLGGSASDVAYAVDLDGAGQAVVTGSTSSADFPVTPGAYDTSYNGAGDIFVAQFNVSATDLLWNTYVGGAGVEESFALILDPDGRATVSGETDSPDYPTTADGYDRTYAANRDAFITQISPAGGTLLWSTYLGGGEFDSGWDFAIDASGRPLLTGPTRSVDFPTTAGAYDRTYNGGLEDAFLLRLAIPSNPSSSPSARSASAPAVALWAGPNPFRESLRLRWSLPQPSTARLLVYDAAGRRTAAVISGLRLAPAGSMSWPGPDAQNHPLDPGVYWLRLETESGVVQTKVVCVR